MPSHSRRPKAAAPAPPHETDHASHDPAPSNSEAAERLAAHRHGGVSVDSLSSTAEPAHGGVSIDSLETTTGTMTVEGETDTYNLPGGGSVSVSSGSDAS